MVSISSDFTLEIIRPSKSTLLSVRWVEVEGLTGSFTVGPDHSPLVAILKPGGMLMYTNAHGGVESIEVSGGTFSINQGKVVVILDR